MKAFFPGICVSCGGPIERGQEVVDSGLRGPRGGKKLAHSGCARRNPMNNGLPNPSMEIPFDWPLAMYQYGPKPILGHWTTDTEYVYNQFARDNSGEVRKSVANTLLDDIRAGKAVDSYYVDKKGTFTAIVTYYDGRRRMLYGAVAHALADGRRRTWDEPFSARENTEKLKPLDVPHYLDFPRNAGPYLPQMFPYGVGGRPAEYGPPTPAKKNPRSRAKRRARRNTGTRGGFSPAERAAAYRAHPELFLKPESGGWPVMDAAHIGFALDYFRAGRGRHSEYPMLARRLAAIYPPSMPANNWIWQRYAAELPKYERWAGRGRMPTVAELKARRRAA